MFSTVTVNPFIFNWDILTLQFWLQLHTYIIYVYNILASFILEGANITLREKRWVYNFLLKRIDLKWQVIILACIVANCFLRFHVSTVIRIGDLVSRRLSTCFAMSKIGTYIKMVYLFDLNKKNLSIKYTREASMIFRRNT